ncbi:PREDICTED: auxin-responsive protein SAUR32 [Tarenaya hassleriana]|uniref:auxin-responsive protein SAUR32 n=1 Tax=Tarenaya hassleriana TaxID=28532 RepID=UPI00053C4060|nr:PREDICTED: auxin-responsive protein SAUR32 [Tarenaya hassleriana]
MGFGHQKHQTRQRHNNQDQMIFKFHFHVPHLHFHHHHHHPRGFMTIMVGHEDDEGLHRFVIPVIYVNHPLFLRLLKEAEEEYGFNHDGPITIPCHVDEFRHVQDIIDEETHRRHSHDHSHHFSCFKV